MVITSPSFHSTCRYDQLTPKCVSISYLGNMLPLTLQEYELGRSSTIHECMGGDLLSPSFLSKVVCEKFLLNDVIQEVIREFVSANISPPSFASDQESQILLLEIRWCHRSWRCSSWSFKQGKEKREFRESCPDIRQCLSSVVNSDLGRKRPTIHVLNSKSLKNGIKPINRES